MSNEGYCWNSTHQQWISSRIIFPYNETSDSFFSFINVYRRVFKIFWNIYYKTFYGNSSRGTTRSETISGYRESFKIWKMLSVSPWKVFMFLRYWHFCCDFLVMKENSFIRKLGKIPKFMTSHLLPDISRSKGSQTKNFVS